MALTEQLFLQFTFEGKPLAWRSYFQAFEMRKSISNQASQAVFTFLGVSMDMIAEVSLEENKNFGFRWGNPPNISIPHNYVIHGIDQRYEGDTSIVKLNLIDNRIHMMANSGFNAHTNKSFSAVVKDVSQTYQKFPPAVVAEAKKLTNLTQTGSNHWQFLSALEREGAQAQADGATDYRLFFKGGNELHFHPPDYQQAPYKTIPIFTAATAPDARIRFSPWKSILGGSQGYKASTFLRDEVRPYSSGADEKNAFSGNVGLGNRQNSITPQKSNEFGSFIGKYLRSQQHTSELIDRDAEVGAAGAIAAGNSLEVSTEGDPGLEPGQLINLAYKTQGGQPVQAEALWLVEEVYHHIVGSTHGSTRVRVSRTGGAGKGAANSGGKGAIPGLYSNTNIKPGRGQLSLYDGRYSTNVGTGSGTNRSSKGII